MSENESEAVYLVPGDKTIFAIPVSVCEKYKLEGQSLESAKIALSGDVVGQSSWDDFYSKQAMQSYSYNASSNGYTAAGGLNDFSRGASQIGVGRSPY